jgi:pimeloyl-ACP methyl ester carboxylesterase
MRQRSTGCGTIAGVRLSAVDYGGRGPGILLLHGLLGNAATWASTAAWLTAYGRVVALDARGHGASAKPDGPYDRAARVGDAAAAVRQLGLAPALLIGHSMGAVTAWQLAGDEPDLVCGIVIGDMAAVHADTMPWWRSWIADWPVPFPNLAAVRAYFGREHPADGEYLARAVRRTTGGLVPQVAPEHALAIRASWNDHDLSAELDAVRCPALVIRGAKSEYDRAALEAMARRLPLGRYAEVPDAGHLLHLHNPAGWRAVVEPFVAELLRRGGG